MTVALSEPVTAPAPLTGFTIGLTAARRREELATLLERRGARVVSAPAIRIVPLEDDRELLGATEACVATPPDVVVATTGIGFRGWMEAADGWGVGEALRARLGDARLLARGPKARGAIRAVGLTEEWSPDSESMSEVLDHLLAKDLTRVRVAVQLHGEALPDFVDALRSAGADVITVPVYRWERPDDDAPLRRLVELVVAAQVDAVAFTSAPAVASLLDCAEEMGLREPLLDAMRSEVLAACVGPVCAGPLDRNAVPSIQPERARLGNLVREIVEELPARRSRPLRVHGCSLDIRGHGVILDGSFVALPPVPMAVISALAEVPGRVCSRRELLAWLPGGGTDEHAVEMAVTRLRSLVGDTRLVQTVVKRGYRLAYDPEHTNEGEPPEGVPRTARPIDAH